MFIMPVLLDKKDVKMFKKYHDVFDLMMEEEIEKHYLIIDCNTLIWVGVGTEPGKFALQLRSRTYEMSGDLDRIKSWGNIGLFADFFSIDSAIQRLFSHTGYCVSECEFMSYNGQKLKGNAVHKALAYFITYLLQDNPKYEWRKIMNEVWDRTTQFDCEGEFENMKFLIDGSYVPNLEIWFWKFCEVALS